ncbi:MAG: choice-of-anchor X domain-containing protein, partial [Anaerolineae bacterium]
STTATTCVELEPAASACEEGIEHFSLEADVFANLEVYAVEEALPGTWTLTIEGVDLPAGGVDYVAYAALESDLALSIATDREWYRRGEAVTITATVLGAGEPLPGATVRAEITRPDAVTQPLVLHDDGAHGDGQAGDGVYGNVYTATEVGGYYPVVVSASGQWRGAGYQRAQEAFIVVSPETARLTGSYTDHPQDTDGDGVYDRLIVDVGVDVVAPGEFALAVVLTDTRGREVTRGVLPTALPAGDQKVAVPLEGALIRESGLDGPYTVSQVILLDISGAAVKLDEAANVHQTRPYGHQDFGE